MRVLLGEVAAVEVHLQPVEVGLPAGRVLPGRAAFGVEDVDEDEGAAVVMRGELEAEAILAPIPRERVRRVDGRDAGGLAVGLDEVALLGTDDTV